MAVAWPIVRGRTTEEPEHTHTHTHTHKNKKQKTIDRCLFLFYRPAAQFERQRVWFLFFFCVLLMLLMLLMLLLLLLLLLLRRVPLQLDVVVVAVVVVAVVVVASSSVIFLFSSTHHLFDLDFFHKKKIELLDHFKLNSIPRSDVIGLFLGFFFSFVIRFFSFSVLHFESSVPFALEQKKNARNGEEGGGKGGRCGSPLSVLIRADLI